MAKRKTPKVKDLRQEKISEEQLKELQEIVSGINQAQMQLGLFELQKHNMLHSVLKMQKDINKLQDQFVREYGTNDIDLRDGTIRYEIENPEDEKFENNGTVNKKD